MNNLKIGEIFFAVLFFGIVALAIEAWPVTLTLAVVYVVYRGYTLFIGMDSQQERILQKRTQQLYANIVSRYGDVQSNEDLEKAIVEWAAPIYNPLPNVNDEIDEAITLFIVDLFHYEGFNRAIPEPPIKANSIEGARYRDRLGSYDAHAYSPEAKSIAANIAHASLTEFIDELPVFQDGIPWGYTRLYQFFDPRAAINAFILPFYSRTAHPLNVFKTLREQFDRNLCELAGLPYSPENSESSQITLPKDYQGSEDPAFVYLKDTPLLSLFYTPIPIAVEEASRWEHHWIVAATGHGKTQTLSSLILDDLDRVKEKQCSLIVMDSNNKLINEIARLAIFAEGGDLAERLIIIDPQDDLPLALNLFDIGIAQFAELPKPQQDKLYNTTIEIYEYILAGLIGADMTQKQGTLFRYVIRLLLIIPGANIQTFLKLMGDEAVKYKPYIEQLDGAARTFFDTHFFEGEFKRSRPEVHRRLLGLLSNTSFEDMFSAKTNKLRLDRELDESKVILINTAKGHLGDEASRIFGRFFIGMIWQATKQRFNDPEPHPTYVYIDEAVEYFDDHIGALLRQARKSRIGLIMAHQDFEQVPENVLAALRTNAAIRMAGGIESPQDLRKVTNTMGLDADLVKSQPKASFATSVRQGFSNTSIQFQLGRLSNEPTMTDEQFSSIKIEMAKNYYYSPSQEKSTISKSATANADDMHDPLAETDPETFF